MTQEQRLEYWTAWQRTGDDATKAADEIVLAIARLDPATIANMDNAIADHQRLKSRAELAYSICHVLRIQD